MNKGELIEAMAQRAGLDKRQAEAALKAFVDAVMDATRSGERVGILGFGTFNPTARGARTGRNPQTGEPVKIAASKGVRFAAGSAFKTTLNAKAGKKAGAAKKAAPAKAGAAKKVAPARAGVAKKAGAATAPAKKASKSTKKQ